MFMAPYASFEWFGNQKQIQLKSLNKILLGLGFLSDIIWKVPKMPH